MKTNKAIFLSVLIGAMGCQALQAANKNSDVESLFLKFDLSMNDDLLISPAALLKNDQAAVFSIESRPDVKIHVSAAWGAALDPQQFGDAVSLSSEDVFLELQVLVKDQESWKPVAEPSLVLKKLENFALEIDPSDQNLRSQSALIEKISINGVISDAPPSE